MAESIAEDPKERKNKNLIKGKKLTEEKISTYRRKERARVIIIKSLSVGERKEEKRKRA
jgi:hypothetical protein